MKKRLLVSLLYIAALNAAISDNSGSAQGAARGEVAKNTDIRSGKYLTPKNTGIIYPGSTREGAPVGKPIRVLDQKPGFIYLGMTAEGNPVGQPIRIEPSLDKFRRSRFADKGGTAVRSTGKVSNVSNLLAK